MLIEKEVGQKFRKYEDFLICCYARLIPDDFAPYYRYGYRIYLLKPEKRRSFNPKLEDCMLPDVDGEFGFRTDKFAIRAAQDYLKKN